MGRFSDGVTYAYCGQCGRLLANGDRLARRGKVVYHSMCAVEINAPPPYYYRVRVKWA